MEKKKLLLVAVSVGVVLLIVIGIPLMMIAPRQSQKLAAQPALSSDADRGWGVAVEPNSVQSFQPPAQVIEETPVYTQPETVAVQPETSQVTTITVPVPQTAAVPNTSVTQTQRASTINLSPKPAPASVASKPAAAKPAATPKEATTPAAKPAAAATPTAKPATASAKSYDTYWVQTGAFSTKVRAEGAKESLASKGIASIIDNRDIDGKTWYRVRVGPYMSETEANYWLALVKSIDGFAESQIRLTQAVQ